jgi:hypothetical protein
MPDPSLDDLLAAYAPDVRAMVRRARELVLDALPNAVERVHLGWRNVMFGASPSMHDQVFVVQPLKARVNINMFAGAGLPDPAGLLEGTGKSRRHVKVATLAALDDPALRALLAAAARGRRQPADRRGEPPPPTGYAVSGSKTVNVPLARLYAAWADEKERARWLGRGVAMEVRKATPEKSMRVAFPDGTRMDVLFAAKGDAKSQVSVDQRRVATPEDAERLRAFWKARLAALKARLEGEAARS